MDFIVVLSLAVFATWAVRRRRSRPSPGPPPLSLPDPVRRMAEDLESHGFTMYPARSDKRGNAEAHDPVYTPLSAPCPACAGTVIRLSCLHPSSVAGEELREFARVCANCHWLKKFAPIWVPERIRHAWLPAADFQDFMARMRRDPIAEESLTDRKVRLEHELAETEDRRNELRSQLLSVKNRLDEPDDGPPHR